MPCPCHAYAAPLPCPHLIYTVRPCLIHTYHAMPMPCSHHAVLLKATAKHVRRETVCGLPARVRLFPAPTRSSTKVVIRSIPISEAGHQYETKQRLSWARKIVVAAHYTKDDLLKCWTSSSDISGYHAEFREGHSTIRAWQLRDMACVIKRHGIRMGTAWTWHGHGIKCVNRPSGV